MNPGFTVSPEITFEQAIAFTQSLLSQSRSETELEAAVSALVATPNGARGFFITYLTDDQGGADQPQPEIVKALQSSPEIVSELLVKNLVMSAAMVVTHTQRQDLDMAASSARVRSRSAQLIQQLQLPSINVKLTQLLQSLQTGTGEYQDFLNRWGYDQQQRAAMEQAILPVLTSLEPE